MNRYAGQLCPHCGKAFTDEDQVVVCPECGAPFHRTCFEEMNGICQFTDRHASGFSWSPSAASESSESHKEQEHVHSKCPSCGAPAEPGALFCEVCGTSLYQASEQSSEEWKSPFDSAFQKARSPFDSPFAGMDPNDNYEGIPLKDISIFVGQNSAYFFNAFKRMKDGKIKFNFAAFWFGFPYLLYRKMYLSAIVLALAEVILFTIGALSLINFDLSLLNPASLPTLMMYANFLSLIFSIFIGAVTNRLYYRHCINSIKKLKEKNLESNEYSLALGKKGSVSTKVIIALLILYFIGMIVTMYASALTGLYF